MCKYRLFINNLISSSNELSTYVAPLLLRIILAWEFLEAGLEKYNGSNWFSDITFPFPFSLLSSDINWALATSFEIIGGLAILIGLATRFFSLSLIVITIVAILSVHWPSSINSFSDLFMGYRITDSAGDGMGNYKLPLLYIVMFVPLLLGGAGKFSVDYLLSKKISLQCSHK